jgi:uncharacterized protein
LADDPDHAHDDIDPRWSALRVMLEDSGEDDAAHDTTKES